MEPEWDGLLLDQLLDLLGHGQPTGGTEGERKLAASQLLDALTQLKDPTQRDSTIRWIRECSREAAGFGWWCGLLGVQPLKLSKAILNRVEKGEL